MQFLLGFRAFCEVKFLPMHSIKAEVFLEPAQIRIFESVKSSTLAFLECKRRQLDGIMPAHVARREAHWAMVMCHMENLREACVELMNELIRQAIADICKGGYATSKACDHYLAWFIDTMKVTLDCLKTDLKCLGLPSVCTPDAPNVLVLKEAILGKALGKWDPNNPNQWFQAELSRRLLARIGTEKILWLAEATFKGLNRPEVGEYADWLAAPPEDVEALWSTCESIEKKIIVNAKEALRIDEKVHEAGRRVLLPVLEYITNSSKEQKDSLVLLLLSRLAIKTTSLYKPNQVTPEDAAKSPIYNSSDAQLVFQVMFQQEPYDWRTFADAIIALLEKPRAFTRWNCPPEHHSVKTALRGLAELAAGPITYPTERAHLLERMKDAGVDREEIITLVSQYFGLQCTDRDPPSRLREQMDTLFFRWVDNLAGWFDCIQLKDRRYNLRRADDVEFEKLLAEETAVATKVAVEMARWRDSWNSYQAETDNDVREQSATQTVKIRLPYVENLGAEFWRTDDIGCPRESLAMTLDKFLATKGIETVVPVHSVARAIEHYLFEMNPEQRTNLPMERIAGESWRKMKRGGQRIYVLEKHGDFFIHLMKRKDWTIAATQEARF